MVSKAHVLSANRPDLRDIITRHASGVTISFEVIFRLCFRIGCDASTEPGGKVISLLTGGGCGGGPVTWDVGTVGMTFCIFMAGRKGDLLGDMRLSRERGKEAGLGALEMWFGSDGGVW